MLEIKRLDHFGLVAGVIKDLGLIELIDKHFEYDESEHISTGEAVAGMIINGLGFTRLPMSLTLSFLKINHLRFFLEKEWKPLTLTGSNWEEASMIFMNME